MTRYYVVSDTALAGNDLPCYSAALDRAADLAAIGGERYADAVILVDLGSLDLTDQHAVDEVLLHDPVLAAFHTRAYQRGRADAIAESRGTWPPDIELPDDFR